MSVHRRVKQIHRGTLPMSCVTVATVIGVVQCAALVPGISRPYRVAVAVALFIALAVGVGAP